MKSPIRPFLMLLIPFLALSCRESKPQVKPVSGTLDGPVAESKAPEKVHEAMPLAYMERYENILRDNENAVSMYSLVFCNPGVSSEGYGIHAIKDRKVTYFPDIYHGKNPVASYDSATGDLWLACGVMEGTGVLVRKLYRMDFDEKNTASITATVDPWDIQQLLCERLGYSIDGDDITFWDGDRELCTVTNSVTEMGDFDSDNPLWIGEQIDFDLGASGVPQLVFVPGVKFTTGLVLIYDDMPELRAALTIGDDGAVQIGKIEAR